MWLFYVTELVKKWYAKERKVVSKRTMENFLTTKQRAELKYIHKLENKRRYADRIKAVLLLDSGWLTSDISEALMLDDKTIRHYRKLYEEGGVDRLCNDEFQGSFCYLSEEQLTDLKSHLTENLYATTYLFCNLFKLHIFLL